MDPDLIYSKTASGEEAMHQRTRVMQRNVRMVLILVDSQSTVADLCLKTGNPQLTENALRDLEKGGFIVPRVEQDSLWGESKKVAQEIRESAISKAIQISSLGAKNVSEPSLSENPVAIDSAFQNPAQSDSSVSQFSLAPMPSEQDSGEKLPPVIAQEVTQDSPQKQTRSAEEPKPSFLERLKALLPSPRHNNDEAISIKPIRRGQRNTMSWSLIAVFVFFGTLGLAYLTILFFPYDSFLPEVEVAFAQASGRPVKVGSMRVDVYPKPGLLLGNVRIGTDKDEIRITELRLLPAIGSLIMGKKTFREVVLSGVSLPAELIAGLPSVFVALSKPTARVSVDRIRFEKTEVSFGGLGFSGMEGEARRSGDGSFQSLKLRAPDQSMSFEVKPLAQGLEVALEGFGWHPSQGSPFLFDSVNLNGSIANGVFTIRSMELRLFDGLIQGVAVLQADKQPSIAGEIVFERVNTTRLGNAVGVGEKFSGGISGKLKFSSTADSWATIFSAINAEGTFTVRRGSIRGIDLAEAVRRVSNMSVQGGATQFEQLSGSVNFTPMSYQFNGLILDSGLMQSTGQIEVSKNLEIRGKMVLQMRGTVNQTRVPVTISGQLNAPELQVGKK
jgi:hypothetical protein